MFNNLSLFTQEDHKMEDKGNNDNTVMAIVALAYLGKQVPLRSIQTNLTRQDLPGHPRVRSVWTHLQDCGNNRALITVMGIDFATFKLILVPFVVAWSSSTIPRSNVNPNGDPQPHTCLLDAAGGLALLLHWLNSTMAAYTLQQIFLITTAVCSQDLHHARICLLAVLRDLCITWPSTEQKFQNFSKMIENKFPLLTQCFGFINGLNLPVHVAGNDE